ncbi:MAG: tRNA adenosine(34) deaminase TadA [Eubacteriales bacterium]|nr:tRNA adenosine(34) deaminase TadA [Eubacteriales bacterium]
MMQRSDMEQYMRLALENARAAFASGEVPVGAILIQNGEVVASAYNRMEQLGDATAHAELLCLRSAMEKLGARLTDCTLFVTLEPCAMCAGACVNAKLGRLVYGAFDDACGCCGSKMDLTDHCFLHSIEVWGGILEPECSQILSQFFQALR